MKDRILWGLIPGLTAPLLIILLFWLFRFRYLSLWAFIQQAVMLKLQFKILAWGVFLADLALFYLFLRLHKNNASKGVIMAVFIYFFFVLLSYL